MAELTPIPTAQRASDADYKPLGGYAVAAMIVAGLFALLLVVLLVVSLTSGRPTLAYETLILAVVGVVLSIMGRRQIRRSEGTRTGLKLASIAWWISVLGGGGFAAYVTANVYVLERESANFANKFFTELKENRTNNAFLFALPPTERDKASPSNPDSFEAEYGTKGLVVFRNLEPVRLFQRNAKDITWEHIASRDLNQQGGNFTITQIYRVTCPEGVFEVLIALESKETRKGLVPQWQIEGGRSIGIAMKASQLSRYGQLMAEAEMEANQFARLWMNYMTGGRHAIAHLQTMPQQHRDTFDSPVRQLTFLGGGLALGLPLENNWLPADRQIKDKMGLELAFEDLYAIGFFQQDEAKSPFPTEKYQELKTSFKAGRITPPDGQRPGGPTQLPSSSIRTIVTPEELTVLVPAEFYLNSPTSFAHASIGVVCESPEFLAELNEARKKGTSEKAVTYELLPKGPPRTWRIGFLRSDLTKNSTLAGLSQPGR